MVQEEGGTQPEKMGIDLLKKLVKELYGFGSTVNEKLKDGFQYVDLLTIAFEGKDLAFVFKNWESVKNEFEDLSTAEVKELVDTLVAELELSDENVLNLIEQSVDFAEAGFNLFTAIKGMKK